MVKKLGIAILFLIVLSIFLVSASIAKINFQIPTFECNDGEDNDGDSKIDYRNDYDGWCDYDGNGVIDTDEKSYTSKDCELASGDSFPFAGFFSFVTGNAVKGSAVWYDYDPDCSSATDNVEEGPYGDISDIALLERDFEGEYCDDNIDNDGDGFIDRYGVCMTDTSLSKLPLVLDLCEGAETLEEFEACAETCEDTHGGEFFYPDDGCYNNLAGEKNRCGDLWDNDRDGMADAWGFCDTDDDGFGDLICGCDFDNDGYLDYDKGDMVKESDCTGTYTCVEMESKPFVISARVAYADSIYSPLQDKVKVTNTCSGTYYLPDPECSGIGDDSERD